MVFGMVVAEDGLQNWPRRCRNQAKQIAGLFSKQPYKQGDNHAYYDHGGDREIQLRRLFFD